MTALGEDGAMLGENGMAHHFVGATPWPLLICVLGPPRVLACGDVVPARGEKTAALLAYMALRYGSEVPRDTLIDVLWPQTEAALALEALHSRVHSLRKLLGPAIGGAAPMVYTAGGYRLNDAAGVGVDAAYFDALVRSGDQQAHAGRAEVAAANYRQAANLYRGDLWVVDRDAQALVERERLRASYLTVLARLADHAFGAQDYAACLDYARRLLSHDPYREDAHRLIMRCHVRQGERAQALHQYRLCVEMLRAEFGVTPEPETETLYERVCVDPSSI